ncbi:hypothetical protein SGL43_01018 [Streptomyces globisporus]|uniref:Uncharacterized protein n=1 Tax=Streptomyces globisporus TaxID=1908 RepID=A0ABM9GRJ2_STRGL|nr:hypothetical protein SGL43_01018 [Streptomyces globisporus]
MGGARTERFSARAAPAVSAFGARLTRTARDQERGAFVGPDVRANQGRHR